MQLQSLTVMCLLVGLCAPAVAHAQCAFDEPSKAKSLKSDMVRAYSSCPGVTFPTSNTTTMAGVPGCAPPVPLSSYEFGPKGWCKIAITTNFESPCAFASQAECTNPRFSLKCNDLRTSEDAPADAPGWELAVVFRATISDQANGDLTVIDFPLRYPMASAADGKISGKFGLNDLLCQLLSDLCPALPVCSSFEVITAAAVDPDGNVFARMGSSGR